MTDRLDPDTLARLREAADDAMQAAYSVAVSVHPATILALLDGYAPDAAAALLPIAEGDTTVGRLIADGERVRRERNEYRAERDAALARIDPRVVLAAIQARADAAARGEWTVARYDWGGGRVWTEEPHALVADLYDEGTREWFAAARTDVPALVAALSAVLDLADERGLRHRTLDAGALAADIRAVIAEHLT